VLTGDIAPVALVQMSSEELASKARPQNKWGR